MDRQFRFGIDDNGFPRPSGGRSTSLKGWSTGAVMLATSMKALSSSWIRASRSRRSLPPPVPGFSLRTQQDMARDSDTRRHSRQRKRTRVDLADAAIRGPSSNVAGVRWLPIPMLAVLPVPGRSIKCSCCTSPRAAPNTTNPSSWLRGWRTRHAHGQSRH